MKKLSISLFLLFFTLALYATTYGIFVDGSYSPGRESTIDRILDSRLQEASNQMARLFPASRRQNVDTKAALLAALRGIQCRCGDEINLVMAGHGNIGDFVFSKSSGNARTLSARELRQALGEAAVECCCKINVVIFSCHSGSFINELFEEEHVQSVFTSSLRGQTTHSSGFFENETTYVDEGDWLKGFNHDLGLVRNATNMADAFRQAAETARERTPIDFVRVETPDGWQRGDHPVLVHVRNNPRRVRGQWQVEVTWHQPPWMRGKTGFIHFNGDPPARYTRCNWLSDTISFNRPQDALTFTGGVQVTAPPTEQILAHVTEGHRDYLTVHTILPKWQFCHSQRLRFDNREQVNRNLVRCNWVEQTVSVVNPGQETHTGNPINPATPTFRVRFHVENFNQSSGRLQGTIRNTDGTDNAHWLGSYREINIPANERARLRNIHNCDNIFLEITMSDQGNQPPTGSNIRRVHRDVVNGYSYDIATHEAWKPVPTLISTVVPEINVTNVGTRSMDFNVEVAIAPENEGKTIEAWLEDGQNAGNRLWTDRQKVENLDSAQTTQVRFGHFRYVPNTNYIMAFTVRSDQDEVERNDTASISFHFGPPQSVELPPRVIVTGAGTGRTTGEVVILTIHNPQDTALVLDLGPFSIPATGNYQPYIVPRPTQVTVPPNSSAAIPLQGYCVDIGKLPVPAGGSVASYNTWVTPATMQAPLLPGEAPSSDLAYTPVSSGKKDKAPTTVITFPGSDEPFPWTIDFGKYPEVAAPYLFNATESIAQAYDELYDKGAIQTPFNSDLTKEKEAVVQHTLWKYSAALQGEDYAEDDFKQNSIKEAENVLKQPLSQAPPAVQEEVKKGIGSFWESFESVGAHAKVLKKD